MTPIERSELNFKNFNHFISSRDFAITTLAERMNPPVSMIRCLPLLPPVLLVLLLLCLQLTWSGADSPPGVADERIDRTALRAGVAAVDTTPQVWPVPVRGRIRHSAHDALHARALVLSDGPTTLALVVVDALGVGPELCAEIKQRAADRCGIRPDRILIASTHTHSTPSPGVKEGNEALVDYGRRFADGAVEAIVQAHAALAPASVGWASHDLPEEVRNRRWFLQPGHMTPNPWGLMDQVKTNPGSSPEVLDRPAGPIDPAVMILSVMDARGREARSIFANYALHYVGGFPDDQVSSDYFGEFSRLMPSRLRSEEGFVAMMSNGASGDINNLPFLTRRPPREAGEQSRIVAAKAADAAWHAFRSIESHESDVVLGMIERDITLDALQPTADQVERARIIMAIEDRAERRALHQRAEGSARRTLDADADERFTLPLQAIRVGDSAIVGIPFEVLVEIGLELKERSPFESTMVIGLANGRHGYLPTPQQHEWGGYETWLGVCRVQKDASDLIIEQLLDMLGELRNGGTDN